MQELFTIVQRHGGNKWEVVAGPEKPRSVHRANLKKARALRGEHPEFSRVALAKPVRVVKLDPPANRRPDAPKPKAEVKAEPKATLPEPSKPTPNPVTNPAKAAQAMVAKRRAAAANKAAAAKGNS